MESEEGKTEAPTEVPPEIQVISEPTEKPDAIDPTATDILPPDAVESLENKENPSVNPPLIHENEEEKVPEASEHLNLNPEIHEFSPTVEIGIKIDLDAVGSINERNCESPSSPRVYVSLKSPSKESPKRQGLNLEIADSLVERRYMIDTKISNLRLKQKADEIGTLRNVPEIDYKSRKIAEGKLSSTKVNLSKKNTNSRNNNLDKSSSSSEFIQDSPKSIQKTSSSNQASQNKISSTNVELLKNAMKLRESDKEKKHSSTARVNLGEPASKKDSGKSTKSKGDLNQRAKVLKEKKEKIRQAAMTEREKRELEGCTFKPKLLARNQVSESGSFIIKRSQSGKIGTGDTSMKTSAAQSPSNKMFLNCSRVMFEENFVVTNVEVVNQKYAQISPVNYCIKYHHGYDEKTIRSKAHPMVDYTSIGNHLD